ncbi:RimK family alpha-L-glutamate ligase [Candidatus Saccharibacteria bacterium]|nr:RimK family alpha-L-glutamate ligase [Candidatus Saccharibacteria bacterium]
MNIVILSNGTANYSTKRLKEEALSRGHNVRVVKYKNCYAAMERDNPAVSYRGVDLRNVDAVIPRIANSMTRYGSAIVRQFEMQGVYTTANSIAIVRSRDKLRSLQLLSKYGVDIPKTVFSRNTTDIDDLIEHIGSMPIIIKLARGTHGNGVVLAESKKAAKSVLQAFYLHNEDGTNILLQEFVKESAGEDIRAFVVGGRVVASVKRQSLDDDFRSNTHQGGTPVPIKLTPEEKKTAEKAAKAMGLPICGVDMMRSERGPLVLEVNSSASLKAVETVTGRNVAAKVIDYIEINAKRKNKKDKVGA